MEGQKVVRMQPNHELQNWRASVENEEWCASQWRKKWGFLLPFYAERYKGSRSVSQTKRPQKNISQEDDTRDVKPFPETTSQEVGWLSTRAEFQLEVIGPYYVKIPTKPPENWEDLDD
ncbi:uncharacterized protein LOC124162262 [Ischnura elegans]|uniref:uncharacterized protein LOC124162262 n=1 Tax=Ischnura elegans TaxID=197161 RepID=UPI001ED88AC8|nr:uncharacterized protein LOC124162262 [Ischnura elegans]